MSKAAKKIPDIYIHIVCCIVFLCVPIFVDTPDNHIITPLNSNTKREILGYTLTLIYFYFNYYYIIPRYYLQKKYLLFVVFTMVCFTLITALPNILLPHYGRPEACDSMQMYAPPPPNDMSGQQDWGFSLHMQPKHHDKPFFLDDINHNLFRILVVLFISLMLRINNQLKRAQREKLVAELFYLKAQINPHFLFNTLNTIYSFAIENSDKTGDAIIKLANMMRYVFNEADKEYVSLYDELNYVKSYIELQKERFGNTLHLDFSMTGTYEGKKIAPLILIPFIENAFKHGINPEEDSNIKIIIDIAEDTLRMEIVNNKTFSRSDERTGVGMQNTKKRLEHLYPGRHELVITENDKQYSVYLLIQLT